MFRKNNSRPNNQFSGNLSGKLRLACLMVLFLSIPFRNFAQYYNNWVFGAGAGLSFTPSGTLPLPHSFSGATLNSNEGCASISDENGKLLFYTNGSDIYNQNHSIMQNGNNLSGHLSAFQSSLIVPMPGNDSLYFVFTTDAFENNFQKGYHYSLVNMRHKNGLGEVVFRDALLFPSCTERLTAARHANGKDIWIITNDNSSNIFRSWLINCTGLQPDPVVSITGEVLNDNALMNIGCIKVSPDGKKLAQTNFPQSGDVSGSNNFFQLFDFNASTGVLSQPMAITIPARNVYTCEFSPDSRLLYLTDPYHTNLIQVEAKLQDAASIASSAQVIPAGGGYYGIQLAPDRKIYISHTFHKLSVISEPDIKGVGCKLLQDTISLLTTSRLGLPFVLHQPEPSLNDFTYTITDSCNGVLSFQAQTNQPQPVQWLWDFGDGSTSSQQNPTHQFTPANRIYMVRLFIAGAGNCNSLLRSKLVTPQGRLLQARFSNSFVCDSLLVHFIDQSSRPGPVTYAWNFGDGQVSSFANPAHAYLQPGTYSVNLKVTVPGSCLTDQTTQIIPIQNIQLVMPPGKTIIEGQSVTLQVSGGGNNFYWQPPDGLSHHEVASPVASPVTTTTYTLIARNNLGCIDTGTVTIKVQPLADVYVPSAFTPGGDGRNETVKPMVSSIYRFEQFSIYSRWGAVVFTTGEKGKGWDGRLNGRMMESGNYVWALKLITPQGGVIWKKGTVMLIR
jgi:gliding motility-associated-like protein